MAVEAKKREPENKAQIAPHLDARVAVAKNILGFADDLMCVFRVEGDAVVVNVGFLCH